MFSSRFTARINKIDFSRPLTTFRALLLPFRISPVEKALEMLGYVIDIVIAPVQVLVTAYFIDTSLAAVAEGQGFSRILPPLALMAVFYVYNYINAPVFNLLGIRMEHKTQLALQMPIIRKWARLEYKHIENPDTVDLINRVDASPTWVSSIFDNWAAIVRLTGMVGSYIAILLVNAPVAGIVLVAAGVPVLILANKAGKAQYEVIRETTMDERFSGHYAWHLTSRHTVGERNLFGYARHLNKLYLSHYEKLRKRRLKTHALWFTRANLASLLLWALVSLGFFIMIPAVASGALSVGLFISLQTILFSVLTWVGWDIPAHFKSLAHMREYMKEFNQFFALSEVPEAEDKPAKTPFDFQTLEFQNVSFTYPGMEKEVLKNLNLKMEAGKHYAFVGANGAGKTTVAKLLTRLYDDYEGEILLNNKPLREWPPAQVKACFCALFQDFARFDITMAENVLIGKINGATTEEVDNALRLAGFDEKAAELKQGKDTLLGKTHEDGVDLSGGQWQRLAFARAIISPAPVKILDEPTASLDPIAESKMYAQFEEISRGFTTIFISHRLASANMADTIFVLQDGAVAEQGSHAELMRKMGLYAEMYESQRSWYV